MKKFLNGLIVLSLVCALFGCAPQHVEKSNEDIAKIVEENGMEVKTYPYYTSPAIFVSYDKKEIYYFKNGKGTFEDNTDGQNSLEYIFPNKDENNENKEGKEAFKKFINSFDMTEEELISYLKSALEKDVDRFYSQSYKDQIIEANYQYRDTYTSMLDMDEENIKKIYDFMLEKYGSLTNNPYKVEEDTTLEFFAPEQTRDTVYRLKDIMDETKYTDIYFKGVVTDESGDQVIAYDFVNDDCSGYYAFTFNAKKKEFVNALCLINETKSSFTSDLAIVLPAYMVEAFNDINPIDALRIVNDSYNTVYKKGKYKYTLMIKDDSIDYFIYK
ncbi:MAG: hypothetical protein Q4C49_11065 [Bacillota bacterium]|nr:hypothetical protein [Bacillota bacterium]